ncbi:related to PRP3 - essential splicing factor [Melanopsichium pennsylvanicum]|uniref:Related to PRP3 - essential splicing factor n=2 Tax=Melanopsichium pennsylvanicum TaxID=63383 RepID=A0AAJ5C6S3_9BASI|nr:related to PRP3-essential splicing factor [Melanopsichium pennsylvanicum 4]SNX85769.1 related to PRP3 - essential splicing factor [Melanopsichium pennsylvanicum]
MPPKRPIRNVLEDEEDDDPSTQNTTGTPPKKPRPDASRSAIHRAGVQPTITAAPSPANAGNSSISAQVAAAKARAQALMAAMQNKGSMPSTQAAAAAPPARPPASATASRSASDGNKINGYSSSEAVPSPASNVAARTSTAGASGSIQAQLEAARAKVQAQMAALNVKTRPFSSTTTATAISSQPSSKNSVSQPTSASAPGSKAPTAIHPLLLSSEVAYKPKDPSSSTSSTPYVKSRSVAPKLNPYLQASRELASESSEGPKQRSMHKGFQFHKPGRHVREADELRQEAQMEALRKRIEESARKAGLSDANGADEKRLLREAPPEVEWWDVNFFVDESYSDIPDQVSSPEDLLEEAKKDGSKVLLFGKDSPIDHYVQHPIPIPAPTDKIEAKPRGLMLTKREQRKLRRQRRSAELSDKRDRIKMGLLPPEPPKVKLSNLMRVLTSEAVSDPTKIEARVRREIAARKEAHERQNAERKLTDDQRREKLERKKEAEEKKGLFLHVYKIKHLVSPKHKFKVRKDAQDHALTGVCLFNPQMAVVVVEGSAKALKAYKRLMTVRIDWTDPGETKQAESDEEKQAKGDANSNNLPIGGFRALTTNEDHVDWNTNTCELIFEGSIRKRHWEGRGFRAAAAPTDQKAREVLGETMQGYWDVAKRAAQSQEDTL